MNDPVKTPHEWVTSRLGHGEWQCVHCFATNREIAFIGDPNHCPDAHKAKFPELANLEKQPTRKETPDAE